MGQRSDVARGVADSSSAPLVGTTIGVGAKTNLSTEYKATTPAISGAAGNELTILTHYIPDAYGAGEYQMIWDAGANFRLGARNTGVLSFLNSSLWLSPPLPALTAGVPHVLLVRRTAASVWTAGVDGVLDSTVTPTSSNNCPAGYFSLGLQPTGGGSTMAATYFCHTVWPQRLSDAEAVSIMLDPYQFLIPA